MVVESEKTRRKVIKKHQNLWRTGGSTEREEGLVYHFDVKGWRERQSTPGILILQKFVYTRLYSPRWRFGLGRDAREGKGHRPWCRRLGVGYLFWFRTTFLKLTEVLRHLVSGVWRCVVSSFETECIRWVNDSPDNQCRRFGLKNGYGGDGGLILPSSRVGSLHPVLFPKNLRLWCYISS